MPNEIDVIMCDDCEQDFPADEVEMCDFCEGFYCDECFKKHNCMGEAA